MNVKVEGWDDGVEICLVMRFIRFALRTLLGDDDCECLTITVINDMTVLSEGKWADVTAVDRTCAYPVDFVIRVARHGISLQDLLMVLGHELTHVKQFTTGELRMLNFIQTWWQEKVVDDDDTEDWFEPWEIEARGREKGLLELFMRHYNLHGSAWYTPRP